MKPIRSIDLRLTVLALALLAAFGTAQAQDKAPEATQEKAQEKAPTKAADEAKEKTEEKLPEGPRTVEGGITAGAGIASGDSADRALFGQYNGLRRRSGTVLLGTDYSRRNTETGTTVQFEGTNLLGETREFDFRWKKQGDWTFSARYDEQVRHEPLSASSGADLKLQRTGLGLGFVKILSTRWQLDLNLSSENKEGSRLFGVGFTCPSSIAPTCGPTTGTETGWALLMVPEPIRANHSQAEIRLSYTGDKLRINAGYHGSFYRNDYGSLTPNVPATLNNPLGVPLPLSAGLQAILSQPVALPPDNQSHQFDIGGQYAFTPTTTLNFKLAHTRSTQQQDFAAAGLLGAPTGVSNLGGEVHTTLAQVSLAARPTPKLHLRAQLRYEDRDDQTPLALYNVEGTSSYTNRQLPLTRTRGKLEASWQFTSDYRGTLAAEQESIDRGVFTPTSAVAGISALRQKTDETTLRAELRRRMNENISGAISVASSKRDGSNWLRDNSGLGVTEVANPSDPSVGFSTAIFMPTLADRRRDIVKLQADWQPTEALSLQFSAQNGRDRFDTTPSTYGLRRAGTEQFGIDASYTVSERWGATGYVTQSSQTLNQARPGAAILSYRNKSVAFGAGLTGKPKDKLDVGGTLSVIDDRSVYQQALDPTADAASAALLAATGGLPDIVFRQTRLSLFGRYALNKRSSLRLDLVHQRSSWNDWTWGYNGVPFTYSDGTTVGQKPVQSVTFIGVTYSMRWP